MRSSSVAAAGAALLAGALWASFAQGYFNVPLVRLPPPTGPWAVGTVALTFPATETRGAPLAAQLWYPAAPQHRGPWAPYFFDTRGSLRDRFLRSVVRTGASTDAPVAGERIPVVVYVPGWAGRREQNTTQAQNLASHGYVVAALNDDVHPEIPLDFTSVAALRKTVGWADRKVRLEAREAVHLVDLLDGLDRAATGKFSGRLDLQRLGIFGFSFGGAVAADATLLDPRIRAAVNMDGWMFGDALRAGVARPFLIVSSQGNETHGGPATDIATRVTDAFDRANGATMAAGLRRHHGFSVRIDGTGHYNFLDLATLPTVRHQGLGPIDGRRGDRIVGNCLVEFFDRYLKNSRAPLFDGTERPDAAVHFVKEGTTASSQAL